MRSHGRSCSRLPCACASRMQPAEIPALFAEIESAVAAGQMRGGIFQPTSAEAALSRRPELARRDRVSRWPGSGSTSEATFSITNREVSLTASRRSSSDFAHSRSVRARLQSCRKANERALSPCGDRGSSSRSPKPNTPGASRRFTSGFAPAMSISSTSPRR